MRVLFLLRLGLQKLITTFKHSRRVIVDDPPITDTAVYHCQQAAEKALKAILIQHCQPVRKSHDLVALITHCARIDSDFIRWIDAAAILTPYATHYRYPCNEPDPGLDETLEAINLATSLVAFVRKKLNIEGNKN